MRRITPQQVEGRQREGIDVMEIISHPPLMEQPPSPVSPPNVATLQSA